MRAIRKRIEEKRQGLYSDDEIREIAEHRLDAVLDAHEFNSDFIATSARRRRAGTSSFGTETHLPSRAAGPWARCSRRSGGC